MILINPRADSPSSPALFVEGFSFLTGVVLCLFLTLTSCGREAAMKATTPPEDESYARRCVDLLRWQELDKIQSELDPSIASPGLGDQLAKMGGMFPAQEPKSVKVVAFARGEGQDSSTDALTLE